MTIIQYLHTYQSILYCTVLYKHMYDTYSRYTSLISVSRKGKERISHSNKKEREGIRKIK